MAVGFALLVLFSLPLAAQNADLSGTVRDSAGLVVPNASLKLTNEATGVVRKVPTDGKGIYAFPNVQPGVYDLSVSAAGFQSQKRTGITINVADNTAVNFDLKVGGASETVTVTSSEGQSLQTADAATGQVIDRQFVNALPLVNRSVLDLAYLSPGVNQPPGSAYGYGNNANNFSSDGSRNATSDVLVDGITSQAAISGMGGGQSGVSYTPSVDAVQEFKVQQTNFSAEYGFTGATITNLITRSGTNQFHGSLFEFIRNQVVDANNYFAKQAGQSLPPLRMNIFGGTVGGPIFKNRTFFFFDYQGTRQNTMSNFIAGVPSKLEKAGDFGELCGGPNAPKGQFDATGQCSDPHGQIWDPYTSTRDANGNPLRSAFVPYNNLATYVSPGNPKLTGTGYQLATAAGNLIDPVALKMISHYPDPNRFVGQSNYDPHNNYVNAGANKNDSNQWDLKIDHHFTDNDMLSARYSHESSPSNSAYCYPKSAFDPCTSGPVDWSAHLFSLNYNHVFSSATVLSFNYGLSRTANWIHSILGDYPSMDPVKDLGMPSYMLDAKIPGYPGIGIGDSYSDPAGNSMSIGSPPWGYLKQGQDTHDFLLSLSHLQGRHELKFGIEFRYHRFNFGQTGTSSGYFDYDYNGTSENGWAYTNGVMTGDAMASFLVSQGGNWGAYQIQPFLATANTAWGGYVQDNFHVNPKLTVNVGLRYDLTVPATERHNQMNNLDLNVPSPLGMGLKGGLTFASSSQRTNYDIEPKNVAPRIGLAYTLNEKTVLRAGYGIYFGNSNAEATADVNNVQGFSAQTWWQNYYQNDGATPWGRLSDPFPSGILQPTGSSLGLNTNVGFKAIGPVRTMNATPYEQSWSFEIQRTLPWGMLTDVAYVGKSGTHLNFGVGGLYDFNHLPDSILGSTVAEVQAMKALVTNPYAAAIASVSPSSTLVNNVAAYQLQLPYPEFTNVNIVNPPWASSNYHGLQLRLQKKMSDGLQFLVTYVYSKSIDDASMGNNGGNFLGGGTNPVLDPNNLKLERALSDFNIPQVFQFSYTYALPLGRGKRYGANVNPVVDAIIGGWQTNGIWRFDDGQPIIPSLGGGNALPTFTQRAYATGRLKRSGDKSAWLDVSKGGYFANASVFHIPADYTLCGQPTGASANGTCVGRTIPLNVPGTANSTLSAFKSFSLNVLREGSYLEFRLEAFNALNHTQFGIPNAQVGNSSFGLINSQANQPRQVQGALKFYY